MWEVKLLSLQWIPARICRHVNPFAIAGIPAIVALQGEEVLATVLERIKELLRSDPRR